MSIYSNLPERDPRSLGRIARIIVTGDPETRALAARLEASVIRVSVGTPQGADGGSAVSQLASPDSHVPPDSSPDAPKVSQVPETHPLQPVIADLLPNKPDRVEAPEGSMGFLPLVHPPAGISEYGPIKRIMSPDYAASRAFLLVLQDNKLNPLIAHGVDPQERDQMSNVERMKQNFEAVKHLEGLLDQHGWVMTRGFSAYQPESAERGKHGQAVHKYRTLLIVEHIGLFWALPPRATPYPIDYPKLLELGKEHLPDFTVPFMHTQRDFEVQLFQCSRRDPEPGYSWVEMNALHTDYMVFRGKQHGVSEEWVVRTLKLPGETYPKSVERYLKQRFGAELQLEKRTIVAPPNLIPMIVGREDASGNRHLDRITEALGAKYLKVMTPDEARAADEARKHHQGKGKEVRARQGADGARSAEPTGAPLVRTYRMVNDEQRDRWERKGYAVFEGIGTFWVVRKDNAAIQEYLMQRFGATLEVDKGSIVIDGNQTDLISQLFGKKHAHRLALKALLKDHLGDRDLRIVKTFRAHPSVEAPTTT